MPIAEKIIALVEALQREPSAFEHMAPARREVLAETCRYIAALADPPKKVPPGVLSALNNGLEERG